MKKSDKATAKRVGKTIRATYDMLRKDMLFALAQNVEAAIQKVETDKSLAAHNKARASALRGLKQLRSHLKFDVNNTIRSQRDYHAEDALHRQFGLMTLNGVVKGR